MIRTGMCCAYSVAASKAGPACGRGQQFPAQLAGVRFQAGDRLRGESGQQHPAGRTVERRVRADRRGQADGGGRGVRAGPPLADDHRAGREVFRVVSHFGDQLVGDGEPGARRSGCCARPGSAGAGQPRSGRDRRPRLGRCGRNQWPSPRPGRAAAHGVTSPALTAAPRSARSRIPGSWPRPAAPGRPAPRAPPRNRSPTTCRDHRARTARGTGCSSGCAPGISPDRRAHGKSRQAHCPPRASTERDDSCLQGTAPTSLVRQHGQAQPAQPVRVGDHIDGADLAGWC